MSFTPYNAPFLGSLLGDHDAAGYFSIKADIEAMLDFEIALAHAQAKIGVISHEASDEIAKNLANFEPDIRALSQAAAIDGMVVPQLVRMMRETLSEEHASSLHYKCTSQDVIDTSAIMRMKSCQKLILERLQALDEKLFTLSDNNSTNHFMAYTRMQAALPSEAGERISHWQSPLQHSIETSHSLRFLVQLGGPIASRNSYEGNRQPLAENIAAQLGLHPSKTVWHNDRSSILEIGSWLSTLTGHLGKMGQDICLMAQLGEKQIKLSGGGGSSAMAHKQNPVLAESLVTLAQFNASQMSGLYQSLIHEQERSGSGWMLEWMIMPQLFVTTAAALRNANNLIDSIMQIGEINH